MSYEIRAIFEDGFFRPLDPVSLGNHAVVSLVVTPSVSSAGDADEQVLARQREALREMFEEADRLPVEAAENGFRAADHDEVLYGWRK